MLDKTSYEKDKSGAKRCKPDHFQGTVFAVGFGQNIAHADIKQEAGENAKIQNKKTRRNLEK